MPKNKKTIEGNDDYFDFDSSIESVEVKDSNSDLELRSKDYLQIEDKEYSSFGSYSKIIKYNAEE